MAAGKDAATCWFFEKRLGMKSLLFNHVKAIKASGGVIINTGS